MDALLAVDIQVDFCEGGSLAVQGGAKVAGDVALQIHRKQYLYQVASMDYHLDPGKHWSAEPDYQDSWPPHCAAGEDGSRLKFPLEQDLFSRVFFKGMYSAAYSAFQGQDQAGMYLAEWLDRKKVEHLDICGIATDYCVKATVLDACHLGYKTRLLLPLCAAVSEDTGSQAIDEMVEMGCVIVESL